MTSITCNVCMDNYCSSRLPLVLKCGHSYCSFCLSEIFTTNSVARCPSCKDQINYDSPENIPKNYALLDLIDTTNSSRATTATCPYHSLQQITKWCKTCKVCFCTSCSSHQSSNCIVKDLDLGALHKTYNELQREMIRNLDNINATISSAKFDLDYAEIDLEQRQHRETKLIKEKNKEKMLRFNTAQAEFSSLRLKILDNRTQNHNLVFNYEALGELKKKITENMENIMKQIRDNTQESLKNFFSMNVFVVVIMEGKELFGEVTMHGQQILISYFEEMAPSFNAKVFEISDICKEDEIYEQNVYMQLMVLNHEDHSSEIEEDTEEYSECDEQIVTTFKLLKKNKFSRYFFFLCSGLGISGKTYISYILDYKNDANYGSYFLFKYISRSIEKLCASVVGRSPDKTLSPGDLFALYPDDEERLFKIGIHLNSPQYLNFGESPEIFGHITTGFPYWGKKQNYEIIECGIIVNQEYL